MNFRRGLESGEETFQMAPLFDLMFLLLIFFVVTGALAAEEKEILVKLPQTTSAVTRRREGVDIVVNITEDGRIRILGREYSLEMLREKLMKWQRLQRPESVSVIVRADGKLLYERLMQVMDACAAANVQAVSLVGVRPETEEE